MLSLRKRHQNDNINNKNKHTHDPSFTHLHAETQTHKRSYNLKLFPRPYLNLFLLTFRKEMIGKPTNFQHLCHVGLNPEAGIVSDEANQKELQAHFASVCTA